MNAHDVIDAKRYLVIADSYNNYRSYIEEKIEDMLRKNELKNVRAGYGWVTINDKDSNKSTYKYIGNVNMARGCRYFKLIDLATQKSRNHDEIREYSKMIDAIGECQK